MADDESRILNAQKPMRPGESKAQGEDTADEALLSFPCELPVKVFGRNDPAFRGAALAIVRRHFAGFDEELRLSERTSRGDRYLSLTLTVRAESRAQMDELYRELTASQDVLMVL